MLFRVLIILICVLYIIRKLAQIFLPMLFKRVIQNAQQNFRQQNYQQQPKPDGQVKVDYVPEVPKSKVPDSEGEFVDYEEIK